MHRNTFISHFIEHLKLIVGVNGAGYEAFIRPKTIKSIVIIKKLRRHVAYADVFFQDAFSVFVVESMKGILIIVPCVFPLLTDEKHLL